ncbi:ABC transporter permease [Cytophagales bacterium LB-30]|uniref:ABC transporter permease n=1 Tax=Shiella aurantiaca TaxID=3058365 RepID=A0ABT8F4V4_9BACT|nr:ABC transporter permease [Shiella aurantiaca]MDN4165493.1 ABC transporter permease [Shiella aurantiaca]
MIRNYLLLSFRNLWRNKLYVSINLVGMGIAIACTIVAYLNYQFNHQFDTHFLQDDKSVYRINIQREFNGKTTPYGIVPFALVENLKQEKGYFTEVSHFRQSGLSVRHQEDVFGLEVAFVDAEFAAMFPMNLLEGSWEGLSDKKNIYLTEKAAMKLFGNQPALGQTISHMGDSAQVEWLVAGVIENPPYNSSFQAEAFTQLDNVYPLDTQLGPDNWNYFTTAFVALAPTQSVEAAHEQLSRYIAIQNAAREDFIITSFWLDPLEGMAARSVELWGTWTHDALPVPAVIAPIVMAVLILLIACFNFTNTAIAMAGRRLKEIGIRKVMGGQKRQLVTQFLVENSVLCLLSLLLGVLLAELLVPTYSAMWEFLEISTNYSENLSLLGFLLLILLAVSVFSGAYPSLYISKFEPTAILKGTFRFSGSNRLTKVLLTLQFAISLIAIVSGFTFIENSDYQKSLDLGYKPQKIAMAYMENADAYERYRSSLLSRPEVSQVVGGRHSLSSGGRYTATLGYNSEKMEVNGYNLSEDYLSMLDVQFVAGRNFTPDSETDRKESVIISEGLARELMPGQEALGERLLLNDTLSLYVVGVVRDIYNNGFWDPLQPAMIRYAAPSDYQYIFVKSDGLSRSALATVMEQEWKKVFPSRLYGGYFMDGGIEGSEEVNTNLVKVFSFLGLVALLLSATGLFTLVSLTILKRMKEIGVRKILGASIPHIAFVINKDSLIILAISSALGAVAGVYLAQFLMSTIWAYYTHVTWLTVALSIVSLLACALLTISGKVLSAARTNPVDTLRSE